MIYLTSLGRGRFNYGRTYQLHCSCDLPQDLSEWLKNQDLIVERAWRLMSQGLGSCLDVINKLPEGAVGSDRADFPDNRCFASLMKSNPLGM